jgi:hypothetical protein
MDPAEPAPAPTPPAPRAPARKPLKARLTDLLAEYGKVAIYLYLAIFVLVLAGFTVAIAAGVEVESAAGGAGLLGAAWLATKLTQPLRILATLALTPVLGRLLQRLRTRRRT